MADRASMLKRAGMDNQAENAKNLLIDKAGEILERVKDTQMAEHVRHSINEYEEKPVENWAGKLWHLYPQ